MSFQISFFHSLKDDPGRRGPQLSIPLAPPRSEAQVVLAALMRPTWCTGHSGRGRRDLCSGCPGSGRLGRTCLPLLRGLGLSDKTWELGSALLPPLVLACRSGITWAWPAADMRVEGCGGSRGHLLLQDAQHLVLCRSRCHSFCASRQAPRLAAACRTDSFLFYFIWCKMYSRMASGPNRKPSG